jgi:hypothetical protein
MQCRSKQPPNIMRHMKIIINGRNNLKLSTRLSSPAFDGNPHYVPIVVFRTLHLPALPNNSVCRWSNTCGFETISRRPQYFFHSYSASPHRKEGGTFQNRHTVRAKENESFLGAERAFRRRCMEDKSIVSVANPNGNIAYKYHENCL